ncbi:sugar ABC transporter substrate-binding protein [Paenibacillus sp. 2RAB27]|uniref:ABC transporter substrate-binding protein n=1 Tax=Paenibacillus sp. 2RAB27 TaxID=3232991 RepID=UPI003F95D707
MNKKGLMMVSMSAMLALAVAGCSTTKDGGGTPSNSPTAGGSAAPKNVSLKIGLPGAYDVTKKEIIDGFIAKYPNIKVEIQDAPWGDFVTKIATQIAGGTTPDVWLQENAVILGYGKRGVAEDLAPYIKRDLKDADYIPGLYAAKTPEGKVYGIPHGINPVALAYNKKVFADANIPLPNDNWTFNDLIETAKKLTKNGADGKPAIYGFVGNFTITQGWFPWIKQAGGQALDSTLTKSMFNDPKTLTGIKQLADGVKQGYFTSDDFQKANGGEMQTFATGKAAMYILQYSNQVAINKNFPDADWDVVKLPKAVDGKRYVPMVTNSWLVSSKASQDVKDAAWTFLKYYLSDESQNILASSGSSIPVKKSAFEVIEKSTTKPLNKKAFTEGIAEGGVTLDENPSWTEWRTAAQPIITDIVKGNIPAEEGLKQVHEKVQAVLDKNK